MYSKRIVISIIVIGCLAHFITCPNAVDDKNQNSRSPTKPPVKGARQVNKPTSPGAATPRALPPKKPVPKGQKPNANSPTKPAGQPMEPPAAVNNQEQAKNTADNPDGADGEPAEEKPAGRIRRVLRRFNNFRRKMCPIRFVTRLIKKGFGSNKKKPTDDEEQAVEP